MPINIDSNKIMKFGRNLPTPYIDKVEVYDSRILIQASIYFQKPITLDEDALERYRNKIIEDINVCAFMYPRASDVDADSTHSSLVYNEELNMVEALRSKRASPLDLLRLQYWQLGGPNSHRIDFPSASDSTKVLQTAPYKDSASSTTSHTLLKVFSDAESDIVTDTMYDASGNPVERIIYTTEFVVDDTGDFPTFIEGMTPALLETKFGNPLISGDNAYKAVDLVLFSTSLNIGDYMNENTYRDYGIDEVPIRMKPAYDRAFSDITYEQVGADGVLKAANSIVYRTPAGTVYQGEEPPIQSIDFLYYGSISTTQAEIVENFRSIMGTSTDETLQEAYDNVNYILEMYGTSTNLLVKLNEYRKIFPQTSTAVPAGRFYENFERLLYNTNNAVKRGIVLAKQINLNPIIKDYRTSPSYTLDPSTDPDNKIHWENTREYIYLNSGPGRQPAYSAYADPSSVSWDRDDFDPDLLKDYAEFADVETYVQAAKKLRAMFNNVEDLRLTIQRFLSDRILDKYNWTIRSYYSGGGEEVTRGKLDIGYDIIDDIDDFYYPDDVFIQNAPNRTTAEGLLRKYYNQWHGVRAQLESSRGEAGEQLGSDRVKGAVGDDDPIPDDPTLAGTFTDLTDTSSEYAFAGSAKKAFVIRGDDPVVEYFNGFQSEWSGKNWYDIKEGKGFRLDTYDYSADDYGDGTMDADEYFESLGFGRFDQTVLLTSGDLETLKNMWNEYQIEANYVHFVSEALDTLSISAPSVDGANHYLFGYWFFDYEKSLRNNSVISCAYSITKLEQIFGREFVQDKYAIDNCTIDRFVLSDEAQTQFTNEPHNSPSNYVEIDSDLYKKAGTIVSYHDPGGDRTTFRNIVSRGSGLVDSTFTPEPVVMQNYVEQPEVSIPWWSDTWEMHGAGQRAIDIAENSTTEYTYNILRSFNTPGDKVSGGPFSENSNETLSGYRLACFEHQEVVTAEYSTFNGQFNSDFYRSFLKYQVQIQDHTGLIYGQLIKNYKETLEGTFNDYFTAALDQCNYDNADQAFNKFFIDGINQAYGADIAMAPWFRMPVIYQLHADLLFDIHQGDMELILAAARSDTENIAPETGTVEELIAFRDKALSLWDNYYAMGGQIYERMAARFGYVEGMPLGLYEIMNSLVMGDYAGPGISRSITYGGSAADVPATLYNIPPIINLLNTIRVTTEEDTDTKPADPYAPGRGDIPDPYLGMTEGFFGSEGGSSDLQPSEEEPEDSRQSEKAGPSI